MTNEAVMPELPEGYYWEVVRDLGDYSDVQLRRKRRVGSKLIADRSFQTVDASPEKITSTARYLLEDKKPFKEVDWSVYGKHEGGAVPVTVPRKQKKSGLGIAALAGFGVIVAGSFIVSLALYLMGAPKLTTFSSLLFMLPWSIVAYTVYSSILHRYEKVDSESDSV